LESYASKESGELGISFENAKDLSTLISRVTGFECEINEATADFPPHSDSAKWYLLVNGDISKVYHARLVWMDSRGRIRIESMYLGNKTEWLLEDYGEEAAGKAVVPNDSGLQSVKDFFSRNYPLEAERLESYEKIVEKISSEYGISMVLGRPDGDSTVTLHVIATIDVEGLAEEEKVKRIEDNLKGLEQAVSLVFQREEQLRKKQEEPQPRKHRK
jgi:hypothetical protein